MELQSEALQQVRYKANGTITIIVSCKIHRDELGSPYCLVCRSYSYRKNIVLSISTRVAISRRKMPAGDHLDHHSVLEPLLRQAGFCQHHANS
jgi:hypothetical protein